MNKILKIILAIILCCSLVACGDNDQHEGKAKTPSGSSVMEGRNYQEVVKEFEEKGFTNIKIEKIDDLTTGWLTDDGDVEDVSVGGNVNYSPDEWVNSDIEVIIRYHTFPQENKEGVETEKPASVETNENGYEEEAANDNSNEEVIMNISNSPELVAILTTKNEFDPLIKQFADKYRGKTIEFDGYTANAARNDDYKTRFNYLICVGDYNSSSAVGPQFQIQDVNYYDLHLSGDNVPDTFGTGLNIHIIAKVGTYSENTGLFQIEPIKITMR